MKKKHSKRTKISLFAILIILCCPFLGSASESLPTIDDEIAVVENAGAHGYYEYDCRTQEQIFVPVNKYKLSSYETEDNEARIIHPVLATDEVMKNNFTEYYEDDFPDEINIEDIANELGDVEPFAITPPDNRQKVSSVSNQEASICLLVSRFRTGTKRYGTGVLVADKYVLTAGHVVYDSRNDGPAIRVAVYAGSNAGTYKKYSLAYKWKIGADFQNNSEGDKYLGRGVFDDWALLECEASMASVGHMGIISTNSITPMESYTYYSIGYPFDLNTDEFGPNEGLENLIGYRMYRTQGKVKATVNPPELPGVINRPCVVMSDMDFYEGQSGSPIYRSNNGKFYAQAICLAGRDLLEQNYVLLINDYLFDIIEGL